MISKQQQKDLEYNWHPYTQHQVAPAPIVITKGKDALLWDENGKTFIDAIGSWWANPHGHCNSSIADAITEQINTLEHVLFGGFTHPKAIELSEELLKVLPSNQKKIFYSDNGSTAVEVAIKMALQYQFYQQKNCDCIIAFEDAFHGDTFAAMATSGISFFTKNFDQFLLPVHRIPLPNEDNIEEVLNRLKEINQNHHPAAFIFECLVQGAGGMRIFEAKYLDQILHFCLENKILTIADEVMTGFGRTGKTFASEYLQNPPNIICLSKALTGGFIPMAITSCTQEIYDAFLSNDTHQTFFHGHTFMANPAGCAAALVSLKLTLSQETQKNIARIQTKHQTFGEILEKRLDCYEIQRIGIIIRFRIKVSGETSYYGELRNFLFNQFMEKGLILRPQGNMIYILPPYCITNEQLDAVYQGIIEVLDEVPKKFLTPK